jgi:hypothetical protein
VREYWNDGKETSGGVLERWVQNPELLMKSEAPTEQYSTTPLLHALFTPVLHYSNTPDLA